MTHAELFARFVVISLLAFGGGGAVLPLIERMVVHDTGWLSPSVFGAAVAFGYLTPGPVLIIATFVGQQVAGFSGALVATVGAFLMPWMLATVAAQQVARFAQHPALRRFGAGAAPAVIGILGVTTLAVARDAVVVTPHLVIVAAALLLIALTRVHPVVLLAGGGFAGWLSN